MRLSQGLLNLLNTCPRKFQHSYLEQLGSPVTPEQQERQAWGSRFHLLMQQRELGLPIESLVEEDPQMERCLTAFLKAAPEIFLPAPDSPTFRQAEHDRAVDFKGYVLTVVYDLLIAGEQEAQILDWKTYPRPQDRQRLAQNWQTRLYLYVLAETSDYLPKQISMTYWFVQSAGEEVPLPQSLKFSYNQTQHKKTKTDLTRLLDNLTEWLQRYLEKGEPFPQVLPEAGQCSFCPFALRCDRSRALGEEAIALNAWSNLANIEEVSL